MKFNDFASNRFWMLSIGPARLPAHAQEALGKHLGTQKASRNPMRSRQGLEIAPPPWCWSGVVRRRGPSDGNAWTTAFSCERCCKNKQSARRAAWEPFFLLLPMQRGEQNFIFCNTPNEISSILAAASYKRGGLKKLNRPSLEATR